ncbi:MAG: DUF1559 domain-containing protein [Planctomycetota bacterium]
MVISIIALLIGILLPVLGSARESARTLQCLSTIRQWGIAAAVYTSQSDDFLPRDFSGTLQDEAGGDASNGAVGDPSTGVWYNELPPLVGQLPYGEAFTAVASTTDGYNESTTIWFCPTLASETRQVETNTTANGNLFHYAQNGMLNGSASFGGHGRDTDGDGFSDVDMNFYPSIGGINFDEPGGWFLPHTRITDITDLSTAVYFGEPDFRVSEVNYLNIDRARHGGENTNVGFVDGHASTFKGEDAGLPIHTDDSAITAQPPTPFPVPPTIYQTAGGDMVWGAFIRLPFDRVVSGP